MDMSCFYYISFLFLTGLGCSMDIVYASELTNNDDEI